MDARTRALLKQQIVFLATALIATSVLAQAGVLGAGTVQALSVAAFLTSLLRFFLLGSSGREAGGHETSQRQPTENQASGQSVQAGQDDQGGLTRSDADRAAPARYTVAVIDVESQGVREITSLKFVQPFRARVESEFTHVDGTRTPSIGILVGKPACERLRLYQQHHETLLERANADPNDVIGGYAVQSAEGKPLALMVLIRDSSSE